MKFQSLLLLTLFWAPLIWAQDTNFLTPSSDQKYDDVDETSIEKIKQIDITKGSLNNATELDMQDSETGIISTYNPQDSRMRFGMGYHMNSNPRKLTHLRIIDFNFGYNFRENIWLAGFFSTSNNVFESISENNTGRTQSTNGIDEANETMLTFGVGLGYQSTFLRDFLNFPSLFETFTAHVGMARMQEEKLVENFLGPGYRADWGIHFRTSNFFHLGIKFSWNHYSVKRSEIFLDEPQSPRHLSLSWLSLGLEGAIYF